MKNVKKKTMKVTIDENSGFCFGVIHAIEQAEYYLSQYNHLYCLGDLVHNNEEMKRLTAQGLEVISYDQFKHLTNTRVLIRAHGEAPEIYEIARQNKVELIDATCRVVLGLQKHIKKSIENEDFANGQILIFGKKGHAEVIGLLGQTDNKGFVIDSPRDVEKIDCSKPAILYSQTTQNLEKYSEIVNLIRQKYSEKGNEHLFVYYDTICRRVVNRAKEIQEFAAQYDKIIFVSGEKSSNGLYLFDLCKKVNQNSFFISRVNQLNDIPFLSHDHIGICGATSTPMWLMKEVEKYVKELVISDEN